MSRDGKSRLRRLGGLRLLCIALGEPFDIDDNESSSKAMEILRERGLSFHELETARTEYLAFVARADATKTPEAREQERDAYWSGVRISQNYPLRGSVLEKHGLSGRFR